MRRTPECRLRRDGNPGSWIGAAHGGALSAKRSENASARERSPGIPEGIVQGAGGIDPGPFDRAETIGLLLARHPGVSIRRVAAAGADARRACCEIRDKKQAAEAFAADFRDCSTFLNRCKHRIDGHRMTRSDDA